MTLAAALTPTGLQAAMTVSGAVNGAVFAAYLSQVLGPTLQPGDAVVPGNLPAHKVAGLAQPVEARGARLLYLPPYPPDFNPIELAFSKLRTGLRTAQARTREALENLIQTATEWVSEQGAKNGLTIVDTTYSNLKTALISRFEQSIPRLLSTKSNQSGASMRINACNASRTLIFELFLPTSRFTRAGFSNFRYYRLRKFSASKNSISIARAAPRLAGSGSNVG